MCGRFAQAQTREAYLAFLADEAERDIAYDPAPIGRYNVAPGTKVLLLSERDSQLHLDPAGCSSPYGSMDGRSASQMGGLSGRERVIKNSPGLSTALMVSQYLWRQLAVRRLNGVTRPRVL